jgi:hypothetical protein
MLQYLAYPVIAITFGLLLYVMCTPPKMTEQRRRIRDE